MTRWMPCLRSPREIEMCGFASRPLLEVISDSLPHVTYGRDEPAAFLPAMQHEELDLAEVHAQAMAEIAREPATIEEIAIPALRMLWISGQHYAAEKILDGAFLVSLAERLGAAMLLVGVPRRNVMMVCAAKPEDATATALFARAVAREHQLDLPISDAVFVVEDGQIVGEVTVAAPAPRPPKRSLLRRFFGA